MDLVVVVDATPQTGAGHAMRCAAVAERWRRLGLGRSFIIGEITIGFVADRLASLGLTPVNAVPDADGRGVLLVDSYDPRKRRQLAGTPDVALRVLVDDLGGLVPTGYTVVWNPNPYGERGLYPAFGGELLTGGDFVPLRSDLPIWRYRATGRVGVTVGGGTAPAYWTVVASALKGANRQWHFRGLGDWVLPGWEVVAASGPWAGLVECDRLVTGGGVSVWEAAAVGIPAVVVQTAANQQLTVAWARRHGVPTVTVPDAPKARDLAARISHALADARPLPIVTDGSDRVARALHELAGQRLLA